MNARHVVGLIALLSSVAGCGGPPDASPAHAGARGRPELAPPAGPVALDLLVADVAAVRLPLFREEQDAIRREVAARVEVLGQGRWRVAPIEVHDAALTDQRCAEPRLRPWHALERRFPAAGVVRIEVACAPACTLGVSVQGVADVGPGMRRETLARFVAPAAAATSTRDGRTPAPAEPASMAAWIAAARSLAPDDATPTGGMLLGELVESEAPAHRVRLASVHPSGSWSSPPEAALQPARAALDACWSPTPLGGGRVPTVHVGFDGQGNAARCEAGRLEEWTDPFIGCVCDAMRSVRVGPGDPARRLQLHVGRDSLPRHLVNGRPLHVRVDGRGSDGMPMGPHLPGGALERCITRAPGGGTAALAAHWRIDAGGQVIDASVSAPARSDRAAAAGAQILADASAHACLLEDLRRARFGCPLAGPMAVDATLEIVLLPVPSPPGR